MKRVKQLISTGVSILFAVIMGVFLSQYLNIAPVYGIGGMLLVSAGASFLPKMSGVALAGVYREVWTGEVVRGLSHADQNGWLNGLKDQSRYVTGDDESQTIHMAYLGVKPDVLINNSTYPIPVQDLNASDIAISLDKFQTKATPITDDEIYALSYDKIANVKDLHVESITENKQDKAIHALAPAGNATKTPVLLTTGEDDGTGRKRLITKDIVRLKKAFDDMKAPVAGRRLVLCPDHVNDLLTADQKFAEQYYNYTTGKIANLYGFEVYEYVSNPYFVPATLAKKSFGSVPAVTDRMASVAFHTARAVKAAGITKMYYSEAKTDPLTQRNLVNFRHYFIVLPTAQEAIGAIVSNNV
jgi:hypothetical protein